MDKPVKVLKSKSEIRKFFNNKIINSEKVLIDGKTMYMTVNKIDDSGKEVKHKKNRKTKIVEKRTEMNQTLNFPDDIDYQQTVYPPLVIDKIEDSVSVKFMINLLTKYGLKNPVEKFTTLDEVEKYLFNKISSFSKIEDISDEELINIFHTIQVWGGKGGRLIYNKPKLEQPSTGGRFHENFDIETYRKLVQRCLNFEKDGDWVKTFSKWTFESHKSYCKKEGIKGGINNFNISFSTKHVRYWLYKKLEDQSLPIFDERIRKKFNENEGNYLKNKLPRHLEFYWKQMIEKSIKEDITLNQLERLLFNYWS